MFRIDELAKQMEFCGVCPGGRDKRASTERRIIIMEEVDHIVPEFAGATEARFATLAHAALAFVSALPCL